MTETTIRFTLAFKEEFLRRYKEGLPPKQIVQDLGYRVDIPGTRRVEGVRDHIVKESLSEAGLHKGTLHDKLKPGLHGITRRSRKARQSNICSMSCCTCGKRWSF